MDDSGTGNAFTALIQRALRAYHSDAALTRIVALGDLRLVHAHLRQKPRGGISGAIRAVLDAGLNRLAELDAKAADLLVRRYIRNETLWEIAAARRYSESAIFQKQRRAVKDLAQLIWQAEEAMACEPLTEAQQAVLDTLPPPTFSKLFGIASRLSDLKEYLRNPSGSYLVAVDGMGGTGKTALARATAEELVREGRFTRVIWVTAQRRAFAWTHNDSQHVPALTLSSFLDELRSRLGVGVGSPALTEVELEVALRTVLRLEPTLLVVDNLETAADVRALVEGLDRLVRPSKVLLTTRHRVSAYDQITSLTLHQLPTEDAIAFIQYHARERNVAAVVASGQEDLLRIVQVTDGNPLAIKLVIGQMLALPLDQVVRELTVARAAAKELYCFIFRYSWERLSPTAQHLLLHIPLLDSRGTTLDDLIAVSQSTNSDAVRAGVQELVNVSLLDLGVERGRLLYSVHGLTERFVLSDLVGRGWGDGES